MDDSSLFFLLFLTLRLSSLEFLYVCQESSGCCKASKYTGCSARNTSTSNRHSSFTIYKITCKHHELDELSEKKKPHLLCPKILFSSSILPLSRITHSNHTKLKGWGRSSAPLILSACLDRPCALHLVKFYYFSPRVSIRPFLHVSCQMCISPLLTPIHRLFPPNTFIALTQPFISNAIRLLAYTPRIASSHPNGLQLPECRSPIPHQPSHFPHHSSLTPNSTCCCLLLASRAFASAISSLKFVKICFSHHHQLANPSTSLLPPFNFTHPKPICSFKKSPPKHNTIHDRLSNCNRIHQHASGFPEVDVAREGGEEETPSRT